MLENKIMTDEEIAAKNTYVDDMIKEAEKFADESSMPSLESALQDVYTDIIEEGRVR